MAVNTVVLTGRLTRDPEIKVLESGKKLAKFTLAVDRGKNMDPDFIPVEAWDKVANSVEGYVTQGSLIAVEGSIRVDNYESQGQQRTWTKVIASRIHFLSLKTKTGESNSAPSEGVENFGPMNYEDSPF